MLKAVLDTDVVVSGFISSAGASRQVLIDALDSRFALLLSTPLLLEYEAVLCRPLQLERANAQIADVVGILDVLAAICVPVAFDYRWRPTGAQGDDELVVETAINGDADSLVTFNIKDMRAAAEGFSFALERPGDFLRRVRS